MPTTKPVPCSHAVLIGPTDGSLPVALLNTGSYPGFLNYLNQSWTWSGTDWTRVGSGTIDASGPLPLRADFAMTHDGYNVVMFGGKSDASDGLLQDTWTFDGAAWTKEAPATVPFGRAKAKLALFGTTGTQKAVMFGGTNVLNFLNETWTWDGAAKDWTLESPTTSPSARVDHALAGNSTTCLLFGGKNSKSNLGDTWSWDGTNWTQLTPTTPPSYRSEAALAWDNTNSEWVLFGGRDEFGILVPETWTLNSAGTAWTQQAVATTASPRGRVGAQMCFDYDNGEIVLFGGNDEAGNSFNDTWTWDGSAWTLK